MFRVVCIWFTDDVYGKMGIDRKILKVLYIQVHIPLEQKYTR